MEEDRLITKDNTTKEMTIKVPTLNINNISDIYYEEPQNFENSIHSEAYENALHITKGIINSTRDKVLDDEKDSKRGIGTRVRNKEQVCNIIFFTGDKGTGKTSTMLSYMEFLKDYHRNKENNRLGKFEIGTRDFMFTGIEHIDASSLDSKEDILGSVLSKMLNKWKIEEERSNAYSGIVRGLDYDYNRRQLRVLFAEVYECLKDLRSTKDLLERDTDMFLETIEKLSLSWNVKQAFQRLVERYLDIMVYPGSEKSINKDNHFLVT